MNTFFVKSLCTVALFTATGLSAQNGIADSSFNGNGIIESDDEIATSACFDAAGKIVVIGHDRFSSSRNIFIKRYNNNGTADNTFGTGGRFEHDINSDYDYARCIKPVSGGKYLISGQNSTGPYFRPYVLRINSNGTLDNTFGNLGISIINSQQNNADAWAFSVAQSGSIYIAGYKVVSGTIKAVLWKMKSNGSIDSGFGVNGEKVISTNAYTERFFAIDIDENNNRIVACGTSNDISTPQGLIAMLDTNGNLKSAFNGNGIVKYTYSGNPTNLYDIRLSASKIVAAGNHVTSAGNVGLVTSFLHNGSANSSFAGTGTYENTVSSVSSYSKLLMDCKGNYYAAGNILQLSSTSMLTTKFQSNGYTDSTFSINGHFIIRVNTNYDEFVEAMDFNGNNSLVIAGRINSGSGTTRSGMVKIKLSPCNTSDISIPIVSTSNSKLYPTILSAGQLMQLEFSTPHNIVKIEIVSQTGQRILPVCSETDKGMCIRTDGLAGGIYNCILHSGESTEVLRFVVE